MMMGERLKGFWQACSHRERRALCAGAAALIVLVGYFLLWQPLQRDLARMEEQLPRLRGVAAQLGSAGAEIARLRAKAPAGALDARQLASLVERSAIAHGLKVAVTQKNKTGRRMTATVEGAPFQAWLSWVDEMHRAHRIVLISGRVSALDAPGMIRADITLAAAAETR